MEAQDFSHGPSLCVNCKNEDVLFTKPYKKDSLATKLYRLLGWCSGLVQRCVIIQRDENGFGLTVSGDNPVFVQLVKEGESVFLGALMTNQARTNLK